MAKFADAQRRDFSEAVGTSAHHWTLALVTYLPKVLHMLKWALFFFIVAIIAAFFGFTGIAAAAASIAKILFFAFIVICVIFLILGLIAGRAIL